MAGTEEMGKTPRGHDVGRAGCELVVADGLFFYIYQLAIDDIKAAPKLQTSTARSGVGRDTGWSPAA